MEVIKKKVKQITTTATTDGGYEIIPDVNAVYGFNILLTSQNKDWGYFDTYEDEESTAVGAEISPNTYVVTGTSSSRLQELKKFSTSNDLSIGYVNSNDPLIDGVNTNLSTANKTVYYIGGITYNDFADGTTTFSFVSQGYNSPDFTNKPIIKIESKQNIVDRPEVDNNVFIIRQSLPVFENIYRLQDITTIDQLENYGGGSKFNIINNS